MNALRRSLLCAVVGLFAWAHIAHAQSPSAITATPLLGSDGARPGTELRAAVEVTVPDGLHIQSNKPKDPNLVPAAVFFDLPAGVSVSEIVFPPSTTFTLRGDTEANPVFEGRVEIGVRFAIAKNVPIGPLEIPARMQLQACNDSSCFPPKTLKFAWQVPVIAATAHVTSTHEDVFRQIAFGHGEAPPAAPVETAAALPSVPSSSAAATVDDVALLDHFTILGTTNFSTTGEFVAFIQGAENGTASKGLFDGEGPIAILSLIFLGGLALNLTPCVLPMIPINLAIIGAGSSGAGRGRGFLLGGVYGLAMAVAYGVLGLVVILTAGTLGTINSSPWFNIGIAILFVVLGLAMFDVVSVDFSKYSSGIRFGSESRGTFFLAFAMGTVAALLAGACVAPVVVQVVVFASNLYAGGVHLALALPFVLGLGMALPWPLAGAGFAALPKPGAWMVRVKQAIGVFILASAAYYGYVAYGIFASRAVDPESVRQSVAEQLKAGWYGSLGDGLREAEQKNTPVLIDLWATWCKDCLVMDETTLKDPSVTAALSGYTKIKFQAEDANTEPTKDLMRRVGAVGLPTYVILKPKNSSR